MASLLAAGAMMRPATIATTRSRPREALPSISLSEAEPAHGDAHGLHMPMRQRADAVEAAARRRKLPALEHQPDGLGLLQRQGRQVGDGALPDALAFPDAFAQKDGGFGASIGHEVDVHAAQSSRFAMLQPESC